MSINKYKVNVCVIPQFTSEDQPVTTHTVRSLSMKEECQTAT